MLYIYDVIVAAIEAEISARRLQGSMKTCYLGISSIYIYIGTKPGFDRLLNPSKVSRESSPHEDALERAKFNRLLLRLA